MISSRPRALEKQGNNLLSSSSRLPSSIHCWERIECGSVPPRAECVPFVVGLATAVLCKGTML